MYYRYFAFGLLSLFLFANCGTDDTQLACEQGDFDLSYENNTLVIGGSSFTFLSVSAGAFNMGSPVNQEGHQSDETEHTVQMNGYRIMNLEMTQEAYELITCENPSLIKGADLPVTNITYAEANNFIAVLNDSLGTSFRLPTEAEWEYAAKEGNENNSFLYAGGNSLASLGHFEGNSSILSSVGTKTPNALGVKDMSGNAWEWVSDWYTSSYDTLSSQNPQGPSQGDFRVIKGGSFRTADYECRSSAREKAYPESADLDVGFRLVLD